MKKLLIILTLNLCAIAIFAQIPPGYYDGTEGLTGDTLKSALNDIIDGHTELSYSNVWDALRDTDEDPDNPDNVILLYTGWSVSNSGYPTWNREHTWAKSHGDFGETPPCGTDVHHLRPTDVQVNSDRGNLDFDYSDNPYSTIPGCYYDSNSWEPRDEVKGDVARIIFYMATRYEGENGELDLVVVDEVNTAPAPEHGKLSTLLEWNTLDPPSEFEETRNDRIYENWQGNRNPFIDHPEFADYIWGGGAPEIVANFIVDVNVGNPPLLVNFTDTSVGTDIILWSWDLDGDGNEDSDQQNPSFTYNNEGFYTVSLTIEDNLGNTDTEIKEDFIHVTSGSIPIEIYFESFEGSIQDWSVISLSSNNDWQLSDETSNYTFPSSIPDGSWYAYANNYNADEPGNDWLISPEIDLGQHSDPFFNFMAWTKFADSITGLEVYVSDNFTGDPLTADWTIMQANLPAQNSDLWQTSGDIDLNAFTNDEIHIGFKYSSTGTGANSTTAWAVDALSVMGSEITSLNSTYDLHDYNLANYPNPFSYNSSGTMISYDLPVNEQTVKIDIFNIKGQIIKEFNNVVGDVIWDGYDKENHKVSSGIYFIKLSIDNKIISSSKCLIIR